MSSVSEARVRYERHCRSSVASCLKREVRMSCKIEINNYMFSYHAICSDKNLQ